MPVCGASHGVRVGLSHGRLGQFDLDWIGSIAACLIGVPAPLTRSSRTQKSAKRGGEPCAWRCVEMTASGARQSRAFRGDCQGRRDWRQGVRVEVFSRVHVWGALCPVPRPQAGSVHAYSCLLGRTSGAGLRIPATTAAGQVQAPCDLLLEIASDESTGDEAPAIGDNEERELERQRDDCRRHHHHPHRHQHGCHDEVYDQEREENEETDLEGA